MEAVSVFMCVCVESLAVLMHVVLFNAPPHSAWFRREAASAELDGAAVPGPQGVKAETGGGAGGY